MSAIDEARALVQSAPGSSRALATSTLALAEEQRTANVLALAALLPADSFNSPRERGALLNMAREAMGLS